MFQCICSVHFFELFLQCSFLIDWHWSGRSVFWWAACLSLYRVWFTRESSNPCEVKWKQYGHVFFASLHSWDSHTLACEVHIFACELENLACHIHSLSLAVYTCLLVGNVGLWQVLVSDFYWWISIKCKLRNLHTHIVNILSTCEQGTKYTHILNVE